MLRSQLNQQRVNRTQPLAPLSKSNVEILDSCLTSLTAQRIQRRAKRIRKFGIVTISPILANSTKLNPAPLDSACSRTITLLAAPSNVSPPASVLAPARATHALTLTPVNPAACSTLMYTATNGTLLSNWLKRRLVISMGPREAFWSDGFNAGT